MLKSHLKIKPSILISVGLVTGIGLWLYSGVDQYSGKADASDKTEVASTQGHEQPSYKTSVRYLESTAVNHDSVLTLTAQTQFDRAAILRAETYGQVTKLDVEETYKVNKGAVVAQLEIEDRGASSQSQ